jgi:hypothetical protein
VFSGAPGSTRDEVDVLVVIVGVVIVVAVEIVNLVRFLGNVKKLAGIFLLLFLGVGGSSSTTVVAVEG